MQKDHEYYNHNIECPILYSIKQIQGITLLNELVIKYFLRTISKLGLEKYCSEVKIFSNSKIDPIKRGFDENNQYKSDNFMASYTLDVDKDLSMEDTLSLNCIVSEIIECLHLSGFKIPVCDLATVGCSLIHMIKILDANCMKLTTIARCNINCAQGSLNLALYPTLSLFNHSCDPNVMPCGILNNRTRVLKALQPIPKGSQVIYSHFKFNIRIGSR